MNISNTIIILVTIFAISISIGNSVLYHQTVNATTDRIGQDTWKKYSNPQMGFSVDYPTYNGLADIKENPTGIIRSVEISIPTFGMVFHISNDSMLDPQKQAILSQTQDQNNQKKVSEIAPIVVNGVRGYTYFTMNPYTQFTTANLFFKNAFNNYYEIYLSGPYTESYVNILTKVQNSLRFLN
ncbi:MAG: hypothetical protein M3162_08050 [Thermoproteota archaeon]|nr:hypothetical protein [Thermoproteota archaeon]